MSAMELKDIDLNLLVVFNQLLIERREHQTLLERRVVEATRDLEHALGQQLLMLEAARSKSQALANQLVDCGGVADWVWSYIGGICIGDAICTLARWFEVFEIRIFTPLSDDSSIESTLD